VGNHPAKEEIMRRDDGPPERRLLRRDAEAAADEKDERRREEEVPEVPEVTTDPAPEGAALHSESEGLLLFLQTSGVAIVLPYHYEFAAAVVPGPDGLQ
jgi:hypothetical protein